MAAEQHGALSRSVPPDRRSLGFWRVCGLAAILLVLGVVDLVAVELVGLAVESDGSWTGLRRPMSVGGVVAIGVATWYTMAWRPVRSRRAAMPCLVLCAVMTLVAGRAMDRATVGIVVPRELRHAPGAEATREAGRAMAVGRGCASGTKRAILPLPYQWCASPDRVTYFSGRYLPFDVTPPGLPFARPRTGLRPWADGRPDARPMGHVRPSPGRPVVGVHGTRRGPARVCILVRARAGRLRTCAGVAGQCSAAWTTRHC